MIDLKSLAILFSLAYFFPTTSAADDLLNERSTAVTLVNNAAQMFQQQGKDATLAELNKPNGKFAKGEVYVFAYDMSGVMVAHPTNPKLIGQNLLEKPDANGKLFRKEIIEGVKAKRDVWVDYVYKNPTTGKLEDKTTYARPVYGQYVFAAGFYR